MECGCVSEFYRYDVAYGVFEVDPIDTNDGGCFSIGMKSYKESLDMAWQWQDETGTRALFLILTYGDERFVLLPINLEAHRQFLTVTHRIKNRMDKLSFQVRTLLMDKPN